MRNISKCNYCNADSANLYSVCVEASFNDKKVSLMIVNGPMPSVPNAS